MSPKSVFVSHSSKDDATVRQIRQSLESLHIPVWTDSEYLSPGDPLTPKITQAIETATHFLAILSLNALNSPWVRKEIRHAQQVQQSKGEAYKIIPVMLPGIEPPALAAWFDQEPVGLKLTLGPGGVAAALPQLLAALDITQPTETIANLQAQLTPLADLILELSDPAIQTTDNLLRATAVATLTHQPPDNAPKVESKRYRFTAPLGPIEAEELAWYLERYLIWPSGPFIERARRVEAALPEWGRQLYNALLHDHSRDPLAAWNAAPPAAERRFTIKIDKELVAGAPAEKQAEANEAATLLLALPWELLHDDRGFLFQGARGVRVRRSLPNRHPQPALATQPPIRVLLVSPRPEDDSAAYLDHRVSARPVVEALSRLGPLAEFKILEAPTFPALQQELDRAQAAPYHVIHFDGHGVYDPETESGALCFEDPTDSAKTEHRRSQNITADQIAQVIHNRRVPLFFLEACQTAKPGESPNTSVAGRLLESGVASVAAMSHSVLVETARRFVTAFYRDLLSGKRVGQAMLAAQKALKSDTFRAKTFTGDLHLEDWFVPVLFQEEQDPQLIREVPSRQIRDVLEEQQELSLGEIPPEPDHRFVGRSRELLTAERLLHTERYIVLEGQGGEGKTTLAAELARWLLLTRRYARGAFARLDVQLDARRILFHLANQLAPTRIVEAGNDEAHAWRILEAALKEHRTVIILDNMESVLEPAANSPAAASFDRKTLDEVLSLAQRLTKTGDTRVIFTSREPLPAPFSSARNLVPIRRLDRRDAIHLVGKVLGEGNLMPHAKDSGQNDQEIENLVDSVGCHARSLVLIAREVAAAGVRNATEKLHEIMASLHRKHPDDRERSLFASVELSLRRLSPETRQRIRPLAVFQAGGWLPIIAMVLGLDTANDEAVALANQLIETGLVEPLAFSYLRFDPALAPTLLATLNPEELAAARESWTDAITQETNFLYQQRVKDANLGFNVALLDLPNLLAALEHSARTGAPEQVVDTATSLEALIAPLNRPSALARIVEIRAAATPRLGTWSNARFEAERAAIDRLLQQGRFPEAVAAAAALLQKAQTAGESAYQDAAYDLAMAQFTLGQALRMTGDAQAALPHLEAARLRFGKLGQSRMANVALAEKADCFRALGQYDSAAAAYEQAIQAAEQQDDRRQVAAVKGQLATVRMRRRNFPEALKLYFETMKIFEQLGEPASVATIWHQIGRVHEEANQYDAAEQAYLKSANIKEQIGNLPGQANTLNQLGNLCAFRGNPEQAVRFYRQAADIDVRLGDLRNEGLDRSNIAGELIKLQAYDEARRELTRAIECKKPFGHVAEPWNAFDILTDLEHAVGNHQAAQEARMQAIQAYLAYRRDGGEPRFQTGRLCQAVLQDPAGFAAAIPQFRQTPNLPTNIQALLPALEAILAGSRDSALAGDPNLHYSDVVEIQLLLESLPNANAAP